MLETLRRSKQLSIALPASFTRDIPHLREKTSRVGTISRALAIFRVDEAIIYDDSPGETSKKEGRLFEKLLRFQETPQYLRKALFVRDPDLQFAGILPPLRTPSHPGTEQPRVGILREAVAIDTGTSSTVDAGFKAPVRVASRLKPSERVTVRIIRTSPRTEAELVDVSRLPIYWGFRVTRTDSTLGRLTQMEKPDLTISTSRKGRSVREVMQDLSLRWRTSRRTIVLFGSPSEGVPEILRKEQLNVDDIYDFNLNMIPQQGVETVRTEEAVFSTLSGLNLLEER